MIYEYNEDGWLILRFGNNRHAEEAILILESQGIPYRKSGGFIRSFLLVPPENASRCLEELETYFLENRDWPPPIPKNPNLGFKPNYFHLGIVLAMLAFHLLINQGGKRRFWFDPGRFDAERILGGDWYRCLTSLTLHVDDPHALSNAFALLIFLSGVNYFLGPGLSILLVLVAGGLGNGLNAMIYQSDHFAVGASTAVFAAVGSMGGLSVKSGIDVRSMRRKYYVPVLAVLGIFAMLGSNPSTDVLAHLMGLLAGLSIALALPHQWLKKMAVKKWVQVAAFGFSVLLLWVAWLWGLGYLG